MSKQRCGSPPVVLENVLEFGREALRVRAERGERGAAVLDEVRAQTEADEVAEAMAIWIDYIREAWSLTPEVRLDQTKGRPPSLSFSGPVPLPTFVAIVLPLVADWFSRAMARAAEQTASPEDRERFLVGADAVQAFVERLLEGGFR